MGPEDERIGQLLRALRRREGISQRNLARRASVPRTDILRIEAGDLGDVRCNRVRQAFDVLGARIKLTAWWNGAAADRLLDARHAALAERAMSVMTLRQWQAIPEVTFSEYGERGSIDVFAGHEQTRSVLVGEVKASIGSIEAMNRTLDMKERLAPKLARQRFGWAATSVSRVLIVPEDSTVRRVIGKHSATMGALYPARGREFRGWLRHPIGRIAAIWFLSEVNSSDRVRAEAARPAVVSRQPS